MVIWSTLLEKPNNRNSLEEIGESTSKNVDWNCFRVQNSTAYNYWGNYFYNTANTHGETTNQRIRETRYTGNKNTNRDEVAGRLGKGNCRRVDQRPNQDIAAWIFTGPGSFGEYLHRFHKRETDECQLCTGTPEITPENIIGSVISSKEAWNKIGAAVVKILKTREEVE